MGGTDGRSHTLRNAKAAPKDFRKHPGVRLCEKSGMFNSTKNEKRELYDMFEEHMWDRRGSDDTKRNRALYHINSILMLHGLSLETFGLPLIDYSFLRHDPDPLDVTNFTSILRMISSPKPLMFLRRGAWQQK